MYRRLRAQLNTEKFVVCSNNNGKRWELFEKGQRSRAAQQAWRLQQNYTDRDQTGIAARNAFIFTDNADALRELDLVDQQVAIAQAAMLRLDGALQASADYATVRDEMGAMIRELERPRKFRTGGDMEASGTFLVKECSPLRRKIVADIEILLRRLQAESADASTAADATAGAARCTTYWIPAAPSRAA